MTVIAEKLGSKLAGWSPDTVSQVEQLVEEIIEMADNEALDLLRSRAVEQEVLDVLDED